MKAYRVAYRDSDAYKDWEDSEEYYDSEEKVLANHPDAKIQVYVYQYYDIDKGLYGKRQIAGENVYQGWVYEEIEIK